MTAAVTAPLGSPADLAAARPALLSLGLHPSGEGRSQLELCEELARAWKLRGAALTRWNRIVAGSRIERRALVRRVEETIDLSTGERMRAFEQEAPRLALPAARRALRRAGIDPGAITDLVVVTCTGFAAPGLDVALIDALNLSPSTRRLQVGFMGCFGAICGLRAAAGACAADPAATALLVCVELCSLHVRRDPDPQNLVASALFADGAAAAVVAGERSPVLQEQGRRAAGGVAPITPGSSMLLAGRGLMTWRVTDTGFAMTLGREVPERLRASIGRVVSPIDPARRALAVHPGGAAILDAVDDALGLGGGGGIREARDVLRDHGNMSSPSVLFVLDRLRRDRLDRPVQLVAFGPGLSVESAFVGAAD